MEEVFPFFPGFFPIVKMAYVKGGKPRAGDVLFYLSIVDISLSFSPGFSIRKTSPRRAAMLTPAAPRDNISSLFPAIKWRGDPETNFDPGRQEILVSFLYPCPSHAAKVQGNLIARLLAWRHLKSVDLNSEIEKNVPQASKTLADHWDHSSGFTNLVLPSFRRQPA